MSTNSWKKRQTEQITCPSGQVCTVRRPSPDFNLKAGRIARTFTAAFARHSKEEDSQSVTDEARGLSAIEELSDAELLSITAFAKELLVAILVSPRLVARPSPGIENEIGPEDIPNLDFWFLFNYGMTGFMNAPVPVGGQEVSVATLETFRSDAGVSGDSPDSENVRDPAESSFEN